jgi:hypothetical protein
MPVGTVRSVQMGFSEARWQRIRSVIPHSLDDPAEEALKTAVIRCCNNYMSAVRLLDEGARTAASVRRGAESSRRRLKVLRSICDPRRQCGAKSRECMTIVLAH